MDIQQLLALSVTQKASDLHLSPGLPPMLRIEGQLVIPEGMPTLDKDTVKAMIESLLNPEQQITLQTKFQLDFAYFAPDIGGFRVNAYHEANGVAAVLRVIPSIIPTLESLQSPAVFKEILNLSSGLILVTGPTGCGKSTTLASMVEYINSTRRSHIITIEDPIEFIHHSKLSLINQRQVHRDATSFNSALTAALREDPDVILIGEMRDLASIRLALRAAETGHLVLATLHTSSAPRAISRMIDVFPAGEKNIIRNLISESIQAVICQTLLKRISGGRVAAYEIMLGTTAIRNLIREDKTSQMYSVIETGAQRGMCSMRQSIQKLKETGEIEMDATHESGYQRELFEDTDGFA